MAKSIFKIPLPVAMLFAIFLVATAPVFAKGAADSTKTIHEEKFVRINGIEQWVTIHGESTKPVILFLHGGPGSVLSPYSANIYKDWEKDFLSVQWDQRGAGRTFGNTAPKELTLEYLKANPLAVEQFISDGIELVKYLTKRLGKEKVILFGTSWGSIVGVKMVTQHPKLFYAYIGHSQVTVPDNDLALYKRVYSLADGDKDTESLDMLSAIGTPPYSEAKSIGQLLGLARKYERMNSVPAPGTWFIEASSYNNVKDARNRNDGDDYSFVNYVGDKKLGITGMRTTINLMKDNVDFNVPVYLIQGEEDLLTPKEATRKYFDTIQAPTKKYYLLPQTAHGFNSSVIATQYKICKAIPH